MQKTRGEGSVLAVFHAISMFKTQTYLGPIRNSLQKPIGGRSLFARNKKKREIGKLFEFNFFRRLPQSMDIAV